MSLQKIAAFSDGAVGGNPAGVWIGEALPPPTIEERWDVMIRYCEELLEHKRREGQLEKINWMRSRLKAFAKGYPGSKNLRRDLEIVKTVDELKSLRETLGV